MSRPLLRLHDPPRQGAPVEPFTRRLRISDITTPTLVVSLLGWRRDDLPRSGPLPPDAFQLAPGFWVALRTG